MLTLRSALAPLVLTLGLALPLAGVIPGLAAAQETEAPAAPAEATAPAITVATVRPAMLIDRIFASGTIQPVEEISVQPQIEGQAIEVLLVDVGQVVTAGQDMAHLSDASLVVAQSQLSASMGAAAAAVAQAEANLVDARTTADEAVRVSDRTEALRVEGTVSQSTADQAKAAASSALARVASAEQGLAAARAQEQVMAAQIADVELRLSRTRILAPVSGIVTRRNAQIGAIASAGGQPMFVIMRDGLLELLADVPESDVLHLREGQEVKLSVIGLDTALSGHVRLVEPTVDAQTRLGRVRIMLDTPEAVRAGLFAEAEIIVVQRQGLSVPVTSVSTGRGIAATVLRVDAEGIVEKVEVVTGIRDGGLIEIIEGLAEGDRIVARAGAFVRPGDRITPIDAVEN